jgi:REase_DpnII-MboI
MRVFGHDFIELDEVHIHELLSLEREGAIYSDQWIDELNDFRHVRFVLTKAEIDEYVRSLWSYELFLRSGQPSRAAEVESIPADIAARADAYSIHTQEGDRLGPPYHCVAGFIGEHLEDLLCFYAGPRREILEEVGSQALMTTIRHAVDSLTPAIRRFNRRERGLTPWPVTREDDVRDLLFAMLRSSLADLKPEEPVPSRAGSSSVVDLASKAAKLFLEVKWIGQRGQWKRTVKEIYADIQAYALHPDCKTLVFVIIDAVRDIPDPQLVQRDLSGRQTLSGNEIDVQVFVREP